VDRSQAMCRRLAWNAAIYGLAERILPCRGLAESFPIPAVAWVHIDSDRRATKPNRARSLADYAPGLAFLRSLAERAPAGAIKLSPGSDFATALPSPDLEIELISLDGECKEATVWFGAATTCRRRATCLPEGVTWTDRDGDRSEHVRVPTAAVAAYVYDPDPALLRAGLVDSLAAAHGLCRIAPDVDYLTSDRLIATPFLAPFQVQAVLPLDLKRLRRLVADENLGPLEIKLRGLDLSPENLRTQIHPRGSRPATLILVGGSGPARAVLARRLAGDC
jgi:THUMP domain-like